MKRLLLRDLREPRHKFVELAGENGQRVGPFDLIDVSEIVGRDFGTFGSGNHKDQSSARQSIWRMGPTPKTKIAAPATAIAAAATKAR